MGSSEGNLVGASYHVSRAGAESGSWGPIYVYSASKVDCLPKGKDKHYGYSAGLRIVRICDLELKGNLRVFVGSSCRPLAFRSQRLPGGAQSVWLFTCSSTHERQCARGKGETRGARRGDEQPWELTPSWKNVRNLAPGIRNQRGRPAAPSRVCRGPRRRGCSRRGWFR